MTKGLFLFRTNPLLYLSEIPPIFLLIVAIMHNGASKAVLKLFPLIFLMIAVIIFIFIFLFRGVYLRYDEIKDVGRFTNRDKVIIKKDQTLVIKKEKHGRLKLELYGDHGLPPIYSWTKNEKREDIRLYRGAARGGGGTIKKILKYFGVSESDCEAILKSDEFEGEYQSVNISSLVCDGVKTVKIKFTETI